METFNYTEELRILIEFNVMPVNIQVVAVISNYLGKYTKKDEISDLIEEITIVKSVGYP